MGGFQLWEFKIQSLNRKLPIWNNVEIEENNDISVYRVGSQSKCIESNCIDLDMSKILKIGIFFVI